MHSKNFLKIRNLYLNRKANFLKKKKNRASTNQKEKIPQSKRKKIARK